MMFIQTPRLTRRPPSSLPVLTTSSPTSSVEVLDLNEEDEEPISMKKETDFDKEAVLSWLKKQL
eukprot:CAMPEP_0184661170 /NCGR_PEP_ID=MMETSP0308-20130426/37220_1 /TAXON_ID=38269 /ORGANISM="Gloeochaete witrockiana, Strain SAG 46.84" /LENGTH=63 /DNA_ID=CAMNT_0027102281 /DNA_START=573 /DNA_END=764 /DNA_ORIENTATION=-